MMTPYALYGLLQAEKAGYAIPDENAIERGLQRLKKFIRRMEREPDRRPHLLHVRLRHRRDLEQALVEVHRSPARQDGKLSDYAMALALETAVQKDKKDLASEAGRRPPRPAQEVRRLDATGRRPASRAGATTASKSPPPP